MGSNSFKDEDKEKFIEFLNMIAKHASFNLNTKDLISYFHLLSHMQKILLPKIEQNILEVKRVIETKPKDISKGDDL